MKILSKGWIGNLNLKNRIIMAPMNVGGLNNTDGTLSKRGIEYFVERAKGGVGLIIVGFTKVTRDFEQASDTIISRNTLADDKVHVFWMNELAERCHDYGSKVGIQLSPGVGRQAGGYMQSKGLAIGPSKINCFWPPHSLTRELTVDEIKKIVNSFKAAAYYIKNSGIDLIHLHGHEGYLLDQFQSSVWNKRTDKYGGSLENRMRFAIEIIDAIKEGAGQDFPIIYRYGLSHHFPGGRELDEGIKIAKILDKYVSALDIDAGSYETWYLPHPPSTIDVGFKLNYAKLVKDEVSIPVIASGKLGYPEIADKAIEDKKADFICLGRPLISDPYWVEKVKNRQFDDIRPCIGCHEGCLKRMYDHKSISCAVNPAAGNELKLIIKKSATPKKVLVIGGGVAGMESARVLKLRGHSVVLIDKNTSLGGNFRTEYLPNFKNDYKHYIKYLQTQLEKLGVQVVLNHEFQKEDLLKYQPEEVIIAIGATNKDCNIQGVNLKDIITIHEAFSSHFRNEKVVVIGGGLVGTEAAINLSLNGCTVTLVEMKSDIAEDAFLPNRMHLKKMIAENNIKVLTLTKSISVQDKRLKCISNNGENISIPFNKIVSAIGMISNKIDVKVFEDNNISPIFIGDCIKPRKVMDAVWGAYRKCRLI